MKLIDAACLGAFIAVTYFTLRTLRDSWRHGFFGRRMRRCCPRGCRVCRSLPS